MGVEILKEPSIKQIDMIAAAPQSELRSEPEIQEADNHNGGVGNDTKTSQNEIQTAQAAKRILFQTIDKKELRDLANKNKSLVELWT